MSDLIDRQKAIKAMSHVNDSICGQQAIDKLWELPSENQWIPVTERLPEKTGEYLCSVSNIPYHYSISGYYYANLNCWAVDDEAASNNVVAWMPLPKPYEEGE